MKKLILSTTAAVSISVLSSGAFAQAVLYNGNIAIGIAADGALGVAPSSTPGTPNYLPPGTVGGSTGFPAPTGSGLTGLDLTGVGDAIAPGCFCEGWGVSGNGIAGYDGNANGSSIPPLSVVSFTNPDSSHATSVVDIVGTPLQVTQAYGPAAGAPNQIFQDTVTILNTSTTAAVSDVRYTRMMDWDIIPTPYDEYTSIGGLPSPQLIFSGDDGFCAPNPLTAVPGGACASFLGSPTNSNYYHVGPTDQGSGFTFGFGSLAAGGSDTFNIYYGADYSESAALADLGDVGANVYVLGEANPAVTGLPFGEPGTFVFGFGGADIGGGGTGAIPEPASMALLGVSLLGMALARRRRRG